MALRAGLLLAAAGSACVFAHDDQGRDLSIGFVSPLSVAEVHDRTSTFFRLEGYTILDVAGQIVRGEKLLPLASGGGQQRDVLTVTLSQESDGTRVTVHAITFLIENGETRQASQTSAEVGRDQERLVRFLMGPRP